MPEPVVELRSVSKRYDDNQVLEEIDLTVMPGEVVALLGPNGAGKSTVIHMMLGLIEPSGGEIRVFGEPADSLVIRPRVGATLQTTAVPEATTVEELVGQFRHYYRKSMPLEEVLARAHLRKKRSVKVSDLSSGQRQQLHFALAITGDPDLLIFDESTVSLDAQARLVFWNRIRDLAAHGKTVILTTFHHNEAEQVADRVLILDRGRIVADDTPAEVKRKATASRDGDTPAGEAAEIDLETAFELLTESRDEGPGYAPAVPSGDNLRLFWGQLQVEFMATWRVPEFLVATIAVPVVLYAMFGLPEMSTALGDDLNGAALLLPSYGAYGVLSLVLVGFGASVAQERARGRLRLMHATPAPAWAYIGAKAIVPLAYTLSIAIVLLLVGAVFAEVRLPTASAAALVGVLMFGTLMLGPSGLALGLLSRPRAASTIANLLFLPLAFASGFFVRFAELPDRVKQVAPFLPTYHLSQLAWGAVAEPEIVAGYQGAAISPDWVHYAWLLATCASFTALAVWGYRRERRQKGL